MNNYLIPELQDDFVNEIFKLWSVKGLSQRLVESVYASDGSILDIKNIETENLTNSDFQNINSNKSVLIIMINLFLFIKFLYH